MNHGDWQQYRTGCRCVRCRAGNAAYAQRPPVGRVEATTARAHLQTLRRRGVGYRRAAQLAGVSAALAWRVVAGLVQTLRPTSAAKLLAVPAALADGATVAGTTTHRFLDSLRREGLTRREIAFHLGHRSQQLQLAHRVRVYSARKVSAFHTRIAAEDPPC